jgi:hypothetical protein
MDSKGTRHLENIKSEAKDIGRLKNLDTIKRHNLEEFSLNDVRNQGYYQH